MLIYKFEIESDGCGKYRKYFRTFDGAIKETKGHSAYGKINGEWFIDCMDGCTVEETENSLFIIGHPYSKEDQEKLWPWVIKEFRLEITPIEIDFEPNEYMYSLDFVSGYYSVIICGNEYSEKEVKLFPSEEAAKYYAESKKDADEKFNEQLTSDKNKGLRRYEHYRRIYPLSWKEDCSFMGSSDDYYGVGKIKLY